MEFETPEWLSKECIQKALENGEEYKVTIEDLKISMPIAKGDNYSCDIFQADVQYKNSKDPKKSLSKSLIVKSPKRGPMFELMLQLGVLLKEPRMYNEFSPKLKSIFSENLPEDDENDNDHILPKSYFSTDELIVIVEDLKSKGYKTAERIKQLDYKHCVLALKALAKFHAGSVIIQEKEPEFIKDIGQEPIFREDISEFTKGFMLMMFKTFIEGIKIYPQLEKYGNWFDENLGRVYQQLMDSIKPQENEFNVLNHGDFWISNMLFKYDSENTPLKVKLIDLQMSRYTSPVIDFIYFIDTSVQEQVRKEKFDDLINVYINELNTILEKHGVSKKLGKSDFDKSLKSRSIFRVYSSMSTLAGCLADPKKTEIFDAKEVTMEQFSNVETNPMKSYYKNENYINVLTKRLKEFEKLGIISAK